MNSPSRLSSDLSHRPSVAVRFYHLNRVAYVAALLTFVLSSVGFVGESAAQSTSQMESPAGAASVGGGNASSNLGLSPSLGTPVTDPQPAGVHSLGEPQDAVSILTVDRDQLFSGSLYGKRVLSELEQERRRLAREARKVEADLAAEEQNLTEQRDKLTAEAFRVLADAFDQKVQALREERPLLEQSFSQRFEAERTGFFEKIGPILGQVVRERGGIMIIDRRAILLTTRNIDVTQDAIVRIDALLGDGAPTDIPSSSDVQTQEPAEN